MMKEIKKVQDNGHYDLLLELKEFYNHILDKTIELMAYYNYENPLEIFCLFNLLNDCFVNDSELLKQIYIKGSVNFSRELEDRDIMGIQVFLNGGVCRHRSAMLCDIYQKMGIDSVILDGHLETLLNFYYGNSQNKQVHDRIFVSNMLQKISEGAKLTDFKNQLRKRKISYQVREVHDDYYLGHIKIPNHAIVMVGGDKRRYLDPMNSLTFYKDDNDVITLRNSLGQYFFFSTNIYKFLYGDRYDLHEGFDEIYTRILEKCGSVESDEVRRIKEIYLYLKSHRDGIDEFVKCNEESIENIRQKSLTLRQQWKQKMNIINIK